MAFPTTEDVAQALAAYLAHSDLWPTESERQEVAQLVAERYGSRWIVRRQRGSEGPDHFIVVREHGEVYSDDAQNRPQSVAAALNALEEPEDTSQ
jgi:hypothetical protein